MALMKVNYLGLPDISRQFDIDIRACRRMVERSRDIKAIQIGTRQFIDMDAAQRSAAAEGLSLQGFFKRCARFSKH